MPSQNTGSKADTNDAIATSASMKWSYQVSQYSPPRPSSDYQKVSSRSETFYQFHQASQTSETYAHRNHRIILLTAEVPVVLVHTSSALMLSVVQCVSIQTWRQCAMAPSAVRHCSAVQWHQWPLAGAREHPAARGSNTCMMTATLVLWSWGLGPDLSVLTLKNGHCMSNLSIGP